MTPVPPASMPPSRRRRAIVQSLLRWYHDHQRHLPWRDRRDPYAVWVSEVMLQQTQVPTVVPYFERWMSRFPDIASLAAARTDEVLEAWQGLGYYGRARRLLAGAQAVVREHRGQLPTSAAGLQELPGIGPYSAGAIASIAFEQREALVDGNVTRVLCRLQAIDGDPSRVPVRGWLWQIARVLVPEDRPGDFNQALMELGATVCVPRAPACPDCPLGRLCLARRDGTQNRLPRSSPRNAVSKLSMVAAIVHRPPEVLVVRQPESAAWWAGLWLFPTAPSSGDEPERVLEVAVEQAANLPVVVGPRRERLHHSVTRYRITLDVYDCRPAKRRPLGRNRAAAWKRPEQLQKLAMPAVHRRIADHLVRL